MKVNRLANKKLDLNCLTEIISLLYIYIPCILFFFSWIHIWISIPISMFFIIAIIKFEHSVNSNTQIELSMSFFMCLIIAFFAVGIWCITSGIGGYVSQSSDFVKHNLILKDLIDSPWPVYYQVNDYNGVLCYYIGEYLLPAVVGKYFGFNAASDFMLIWCTLGLVLTILLLYKEFGEIDGHWKPVIMLIIVACLFLFSTFIVPISGIYRIWFPQDLGDGLHWLSNSVLIQYSSNITLLRWVFPQFVPTTVVIALLLRFYRKYDFWLFISSPLILYSAFTFLGCIMLMALLFIVNIVRKQGGIISIKSIFSIYNITGGIVALISLIYISGNILQKKPDSAGMGIEFIDYSNDFCLLIMFHITWILWVIIILYKDNKNSFVLAVSICLLSFPFVKMGLYNDLCMRTSIPALLCLCYLIIKNLTGALFVQKERNGFYVLVIILFLVGTGIGSAYELYSAIQATVPFSRNYEWGEYKNALEFFNSAEYTFFQYVDWNKNDVCHLIIKN